MNNDKVFIIDKAVQIVIAAIHNDKPKDNAEIVALFDAVHAAVSAKVRDA